MPTPRRVRPEGNLRVGRLPDGAVYVGRQCFWLRRSPYANPHTTSTTGCRLCGGHVHDQADAVDAYRKHLREHPELVAQSRAELAGRDLACWCRLPAAGEPDLCHAAVLLAVATGEEPRLASGGPLSATHSQDLTSARGAGSVTAAGSE